MRAQSIGIAGAVFWFAACLVAACGPRAAPAPAPTSRTAEPPVDAGAGSAPAGDAAPASSEGRGEDAEAPGLTGVAEVCEPAGERAYLAAVRCASGERPRVRRLGIAGYRSPRRGPDDYARSADQVRTRRPLAPGEPDLHPVDRFEIRCPDATRFVLLDMYHCEPRPPSSGAAPAPDGADRP
ncbi:MAG: hypothetical protein D6689_00395 [Deltaproteobacteria bacterium]|nr:MAG: hypothetical protein D6689_00395 [Deltaproteobacteria bacterium]